MIKLAISGALGRMGKTIAGLAAENKKDFQLVTLLENKAHPQFEEKPYGISLSSGNGALKGAKVLIEFTLPEATMENLEACVRHKVGMVIGTTGLNTDQEKKIKMASKKIPIVYSSNMSIGVNTLFKLIQIASKSLKGIRDVSIGETHHIHKKDAPSGTAKTMFKLAQETCGDAVRFDQEKIKREGEVIGYHEITFETEFDTLKLIHNAKDHRMFASGALEAAKFLAN